MYQKPFVHHFNMNCAIRVTIVNWECSTEKKITAKINTTYGYSSLHSLSQKLLQLRISATTQYDMALKVDLA